MIRRWRDDSGASALEFALVMPLVLILIVGTIDVAIAMLADGFLEQSVRAASRLGLTTTVPSGGKSREDAIREIIQNGVGNWVGKDNVLHIETRTYTSFANVGQPEPCGDDSYKKTGTCTGPFTDINHNETWDADMGGSGAGGRGDIVSYRVWFDRPSFTGILGLLGRDLYHFERRIVIQNES
ncbi:MAG: TadE/TadG family type IV pilus assembly protein [Microvirgula sp.]